MQTCGCIDPGYLSLYADKNDCLSDLELNCSSNVWSNFDWNQCLNECPLECNQTVYTLTASSVQFIADKYVYLLKEKQNLSSDFVTRGINEVSSSNSFVELSIFYDTLTYTLIYESAKMDKVGLMANLGGNLSLFMGISVFSFFEMIEILIEIRLIERKFKNENELLNQSYSFLMGMILIFD
jgi:hypothetical protein